MEQAVEQLNTAKTNGVKLTWRSMDLITQENQELMAEYARQYQSQPLTNQVDTNSSHSDHNYVHDNIEEEQRRGNGNIVSRRWHRIQSAVNFRTFCSFCSKKGDTSKHASFCRHFRPAGCRIAYNSSLQKWIFVYD